MSETGDWRSHYDRYLDGLGGSGVTDAVLKLSHRKLSLTYLLSHGQPLDVDLGLPLRLPGARFHDPSS